MKVRNVEFNDAEEPTSITVTMNIREAAAIFAVFGGVNGYGWRKLGLEGEDNVYTPIANLFNAFWEDGRPPSAPRIDIDTLNKEPA